MFEIVLFQPEIPPNTGNIIRLCANTGCRLHLIKPLGFALDDTNLRRAGLDHIERKIPKVYDSLNECKQALPKNTRYFAFSTKGNSLYWDSKFERNDAFIFGPETRGLPNAVLNLFDQKTILKIPCKDNSRSLNLSNAVAVALYEGMRQVSNKTS